MAIVAMRLLLVAIGAMVTIIIGGMYALADNWGALAVTAIVGNVFCAMVAPSGEDLAAWNEFIKQDKQG